MKKVGWPTHLLVWGDPRTEPGALNGYIPHWTGCGLRLHNKTWRGWETRTGELSVDAVAYRDGVTCKKCLRTKALKSAPTAAELQQAYEDAELG